MGPVGVPPGQIVICHWAGSGWNQLTINLSGLNGHDNHELDIWPPVEGETPGNNWPNGEEVYNNSCVAVASPSPSPSPSDTLAPTGANSWLIVAAVLLIAMGTLLTRIRH